MRIAAIPSVTERPRPADLLASAADRLAAESGKLIERTIALVYQELPSYARVPLSALRASARRNLDIALRALRSRHAPGPDDLPEAEITVRERVQHGVPVEDMMRAYRINIGVIEKTFIEIAARDCVSPDLVLEGSRLLWSVGDAFTTRIALVYQELGIENALHAAHRRSVFVRALLAGTIGPAELVSQCALYDLDATACYAAVRGRGRDAAGIEESRRQLERSGSTPDKPALIGLIGGDFVGIVARRPAEIPDLVVGIGATVPLTEIVESFRTATQVLEAACRLRKVGVLGLADLSWRLAVATVPDVGNCLAARYLAPLRGHGEFGELLLDTLRVYLANGRNVAATAAQLVVHVNTLRHRLHKFTEITGASLASTDVVVEVAWALELDACGEHIV